MSVLTKAERSVVQQRLLALGPPQLSLIFGSATGENAAWTLDQPPPVVVVHLIGRASTDAGMALTVCDEIQKNAPHPTANSAIIAIASRLRAQENQAAPDPIKELWIRSEPMVNRSALRALLREIAVDGYHHSVIYIAGGPKSGRSHSYQLIRHVADSMGIPRHKVDFSIETEARTLKYLYNRLHDAFGMKAMDEPTHEGSTPGDVASKYAARLRYNLASAPPAVPMLWLVVDFSDEVPDPAVPEFLRILCSDRDANAYNNCVIFILGPTTHLDSMRGDLLTMQVEELGTVAQPEIFEAAEAVNQRGRQQLDSSKLKERTAEIYDSMIKLPEPARLAALRQSLLKLRREVHAP